MVWCSNAVISNGKDTFEERRPLTNRPNPWPLPVFVSLLCRFSALSHFPIFPLPGFSSSVFLGASTVDAASYLINKFVNTQVTACHPVRPPYIRTSVHPCIHLSIHPFMCLSLSPKLTSTLAAYVASCTRWHSEKLISLIAECLPSFKMGPLLGSYMWTFFGNYFWDREYAELIELIECFSFWARGERKILQVYFIPKVLSAVSLILILMKEHF